MKKTILIVLAALLLVCVFPVAAEDSIDLSSLSDSDLQLLSEMLKGETSRRNPDEEVTLKEGEYIIGRDIPAGTYRITCIELADEALYDGYVSLGNAYDSFLGDENGSWGALFGAIADLSESMDELTLEILGEFGKVLESQSLKKDGFTTMTLKEGTALQVTGGTCKIELKGKR